MGTPKDMQTRLWKWASVSIGAPLLGNMERSSFPKAFERGGSFSLYRETFMRNFEIYVKKRPCKRAALSIGALLGNLEGVRLLGLLREKENAYLGSFVLDREDIKSLGAIWNFGKEQGSPELISGYGAQRPVYKA
jgi:hypothetical protein